MSSNYHLIDIINQQGGTDPFMPIRLADESMYPSDMSARGFIAQQILMDESFEEAIAAAESEDLAASIASLREEAIAQGYRTFLLKRGFDPCASSSLEPADADPMVVDASGIDPARLGAALEAGRTATPPREESFIELPSSQLPFGWDAAGVLVHAFTSEAEGLDSVVPVGFAHADEIGCTLVLELVVKPRADRVQGPVAQGFVFLDADGRLLGSPPPIEILVEPVSYPVSGKEFVPDAAGEWTAIAAPLLLAAVNTLVFCNRPGVSLVECMPTSSLNRKVERRGAPALVSWHVPEERLAIN